MKYYAVTYDAAASAGSEKQLIAFLSQSRSVISWSKPFDGLILVKSAVPTTELASVFRSFFPDNVQLMVASAMREDAFGYFVQPVWDWFNQSSILDLLAARKE